jgi:hypothetical protein
MIMNPREGFIALISAVIISALLLVITFTLGFSGFFARFNTLNIEFKKQSVALAEGCVDSALMKIASGVAIPTPQTVTVGSKTCTIYSVNQGAQNTIQTQAIYQGVFTNLKVVTDNATNDVILWQAIAHLP